MNDPINESKALAAELAIFFHERDADPATAVTAMAMLIGAVQGNDGDWDEITDKIAILTKAVTAVAKARLESRRNQVN